MANIINSLTFGSGTYVITLPYATCSTAAGTAAKVATITPGSNFSLETGARVSVKFDAANSASSPTLNVNQSGAKTIRFRGASLTSSLFYWAAGSVVDFVYDGTYWNMTGSPHNYDSNTTYSLSSFGITASSTELNYTDGVTSNIQTQLNNKLSLSGGSLTGELKSSAYIASGYRYLLPPVYSYTTGIRIKIGTAASQTMVALHIRGNSYGAGVPIHSAFQFYDYTTDGGIIQTSGIHYGYNIGTLTVYRNNGYLYAHLSQASQYQTYSVELISNKTCSPVIENAAIHTSGNTNTVTITGSNVSLSGHTHAWSSITSKPSYYDAKAITSISRSGTTFTATYLDGTTATFSQQDSDTYGRNANTTSKIYLMGGTTQSASNKTTYSNVNCYASGGYLYSGGTKVSVEGHTHTFTDTNTAHSHTAGTGLTISGSGGTSGTTTYSANLNSTTSLGTIGTTSKLYAVGVDDNGKLCVNVPWTDNNTDTKVTQAAAITATTSANYPVMLGYSTATSAVTNTLNKSAKLLFDTGTGALTVGSGSSAGSGTLTVDGDIIAGGGSDSYGIHPKTSNYSTLGKSNKYWYKVYSSNIYTNNIKKLDGTDYSFTMTWNTF